MKKLILFLYMSLMVGAMIACTPDTKNENEGVPEKTKQEDVQESEIEVAYEIPNDNWDLSPLFEHSVVDKDGKEVSYTIVGNQNTLGFTGNIQLNVEKAHKIFWFYFGKENILDKPVEVKGIKEGTEEIVHLHLGSFYKGAEVSPDSVNMPSNIKFPSAGLWKMLVYIDGELYGNVVVEVD